MCMYMCVLYPFVHMYGVCVCLATYQAWGHVLLKLLTVANVMHTHGTLCVQECFSRDIDADTLKIHPEMSSN